MNSGITCAWLSLELQSNRYVRECNGSEFTRVIRSFDTGKYRSQFFHLSIASNQSFLGSLMLPWCQSNFSILKLATNDKVSNYGQRNKYIHPYSICMYVFH